MKYLLTCLLALAVGLVAVEAQEDLPPPESDPPPPFLDGAPPPGPPPPNHGPRRDRSTRQRPVERWLKHLAKMNPEEFERLQTLRHEDPESFRREMQTRVHRERLRDHMRKMPRAKDFLTNLPEQEREDFLNRLAQAGIGPRERRGRDVDPELQKLQKKTEALVKQYQAAREDEQPAIAAQLRENVSAHFERREKRRAKGVAQLEKKLGKLKKSLAQREEKRDAIIDQRVRQLTHTENLAW